MSSKPVRVRRFMTVLAASALVAYGAWWASKRFVAGGVGELAASRPQAARAALRELARLEQAGLGSLLDAAVSDDPTIAAPARRQLALLVRRWARRAEGASGFDASSRMGDVVDGVLARADQLTPSGRRWARELAELVLSLAERGDPARAARLISRCEKLYEEGFADAQRGDQQRSAATTPRAAPSASAPAAPPTKAPATHSQAPPPLEPPPATRAPRVTQEPGDGGWSTATAQPFVTEVVPPASAAPAPSAPAKLGWRAPTPPNSQQAASAAPNAEGTPAEPEPLSPTPPDGPAPNGGPPEEVQALLEGDEATRLDLVDQLLMGRHDNAPSLLLELARDESPRVRAAAISALGSSQDRRLTEAAWRLALHDKDPRVARLAQELQKLLR